MKFNSLLKKLQQNSKGPLLAVLIDPDKFNPEVIRLANKLKVSCFLVGGSQLHTGNISHTVKAIKRISKLPVVLFPGDETQLTPLADGLLLPSLVSGRNPDYLIGKHVLMAPLIKKMKLPTASMAYLLLNGEHESSTQKVTNTTPISMRQLTQIQHTVMAAQYMGQQLIYLEAGSGAKNSVPPQVIKAVKKVSLVPLIVGGGIDSAQKAKAAMKAGANMIVVGNAIEKNVYLLAEIVSTTKDE